MNGYERWQRDERRKRIAWALVGWGLAILSAAFMVLVMWAAIVGFMVIFG